MLRQRTHPEKPIRKKPSTRFFSRRGATCSGCDRQRGMNSQDAAATPSEKVPFNPTVKPPRLKRRCRPLRAERVGALWFVTCRVAEDRFWLHPLLSCGLKPPSREARDLCATHRADATTLIKEMVAEANRRMGPFQAKLSVPIATLILEGMVGSALARAQKYCEQQGAGIEIYGFIAMSNHVHIVLRTLGKNLAQFMNHFSSTVASTINYVTGRRGAFFARRYDAQDILDDHAAEGRVAYTVDNARKANLVAHHDEWPGLLLVFGLGDTDTPSFHYFDRTAWHRAKRPQDLRPFIEEATLTLSPLPHMSDVERAAYKRAVQSWVKDVRAVADNEAGSSPRKNGERRSSQQTKRNANKKSTRSRDDKVDTSKRRPLGIDAVIATPLGHRPGRAKRSRRPYAFGSPEHCDQHFESMSIILGLHQEASARLRAGERDYVFPEGTYAPPISSAA